VAASSGRPPIHVALGAIGITEGDEVITSPITDMGSVIGSSTRTPSRSLPISTAHLQHDGRDDPHRASGQDPAILLSTWRQPADMDPIMALAGQHNIP
jgi:hypothetical protein